MAVGDVYEIRLGFSSTRGPEANSVMFYEVVTDTGGMVAEDVADDMEAILVPLLTNRMHPSWVVNQLDVVNLDNASDFHIAVLSAAGTATGNPLPPFIACGFRGPRVAIGVHRAAHRFPLGTASQMDSQGQWQSAFYSLLTGIQTYLGQVQELTPGSIRPVTIRKTYSGGVFTGYTIRSIALGQWETNREPTTQKGRQIYTWGVAT